MTELSPEIQSSELYSEDLAPVPSHERTWTKWNMAAIWVGMAVCIPTYLLASYMIKSGLGWGEALCIIFIANIIVTIPMVLNGKAGVQYGVPFPVLGRSSFGVFGVHLPALVRGLVACGWFGIQTWIGGLAFYAIGCVIFGAEPSASLTFGKFVGFALFWLLNIYFIWKGTESIRWLENFAAPILIGIGLILIFWGAQGGGGFSGVLSQSASMQKPAASLSEDGSTLQLTPLKIDGAFKADEFRYKSGLESWDNVTWQPMTASVSVPAAESLEVQYRKGETISSTVKASKPQPPPNRLSTYLFWLTAMVGFWATMSISISDITRYSTSQRDQVIGQFLGLPGTMLLYSFVGVFVTCATLVMFDDILIAEDAPWDPVTLLAKFEHPAVVVLAQIFMLIATLSTNIAANVIAPANAFANAFPKKISFAGGGIITGVIGIALCPWWMLDKISGLLLFVSGLLGPVLGVMIFDYFFVKKGQLSVPDLFKKDGAYHFTQGWSIPALVGLLAGTLVALIGMWVPALSMLYTLSWFTGFTVAGIVYWALSPKQEV